MATNAWEQRISWRTPMPSGGGVTRRVGDLFGYTIVITAQPFAMWGGNQAAVYAHVIAPDGRRWNLPQRSVSGGWRRAFSQGVEWARDKVGHDAGHIPPWTKSYR